jgi:hypothetical protein
VAVDVGLIRRWIDVEPNRHSEILRVTGFTPERDRSMIRIAFKVEVSL